MKHAHSGDSIDIAAGTYVENIHIGKNSKKGEKISLTITGAGAGSTIIDGGANGTVVSIFPQADVKLSGVTIQNGSASGIAVSDATLALSNCVVTNNQSTAGVGGGIDFDVSNHPPKKAPQLNIDNCSISNNTAEPIPGSAGGGILIGGGSATILNTTISGNSALGGTTTSLGSGIGGGLDVGAPTTISNSTISGNQATGQEPWGGGINNGGTLVLNNVTITDNSADFGIGKGGGLFTLDGPTTASNTIMAGNIARNQLDCGGTLNSQGHVLIQNNACFIVGDTTTNVVGEDPMLGTLQLNAPGTTETQALMMGSPAIGAGAPGSNDSTGPGPQCLSTDQRGVTRPTDSCDIGAYQFSM